MKIFIFIALLFCAGCVSFSREEQSVMLGQNNGRYTVERKGVSVIAMPERGAPLKGQFRFELYLTPHAPGISLAPQFIELHINGRVFLLKEVFLSDLTKAQREGDGLKRLELNQEIILDNLEKTTSFVLGFNTSSPPPGKLFSLDLTRALQNGPEIKFKKISRMRFSLIFKD
ncbi:MAG: hypothetical protein HQL21_06270 [Candidatus Omnitrophica bacterium]|nr:hypothetical protein [Candidatus Omnitrophota bacterium]